MIKKNPSSTISLKIGNTEKASFLKPLPIHKPHLLKPGEPRALFERWRWGGQQAGPDLGP